MKHIDIQKERQQELDAYIETYIYGYTTEVKSNFHFIYSLKYISEMNKLNMEILDRLKSLFLLLGNIRIM